MILERLVVEFAADLANLKEGLEEGRTAANRMSADMLKVGAGLTAGITVPLLAIGTGAVKAAADFDLAMTGVAKTVDAPMAQIEAMGVAFQRMSEETGLSAVELAGVGEAAGQLGIEADNIVDFTRVMADLSVSTNLTADAAATMTARFTNITGTAPEDIGRLGATIVALGNAGASTESEILEMALRIAGTGEVVGLTEAQILGFANALSSVGINAEAGGSTISRAFVKMAQAVNEGGESMAAWAKIAGLSADSFKQKFEVDAAGAMIAVMQGLKGMKERGEDAFGAIEGIVGKSILMKDTLLRAASGSDTFSESLRVGSKAWEENTALVKEAGKFYEADINQFKMLKAEVVNLAADLGKSLMPAVNLVMGAFKNGLEILRPLVEKFAELTPTSQILIVALAGVAAAIGPLLILIGSLIPIVTALGTTFSAFLVPIGLATAALAAVVAGGVALAENWKVVKFEAEQFGKLVGGVFIALGLVVQKFFDLIDGLLGGKLSSLLDVGVGAFRVMGETIGEIVGELWNAIDKFLLQNLAKLVDKVGVLVGKVTGFFRDLYDKVVGHSYVPDMIEGIKKSFGLLPAVMVTPVENAVGAANKAFSNFGKTADIVDMIFDRYHRTMERLKSLRVDLMFETNTKKANQLRAEIAELESLTGRYVTKIDEMSDSWEKLEVKTGVVMPLMLKHMEGLTDTVDIAASDLIDDVGSIGDELEDVFGRRWKEVADTFGIDTGQLSKLFGVNVDNVISRAGAMMEGLKTILNTDWKDIIDVFISIWKTIEGAINKVIGGINQLFGSSGQFTPGGQFGSGGGFPTTTVTANFGPSVSMAGVELRLTTTNSLLTDIRADIRKLVPITPSPAAQLISAAPTGPVVVQFGDVIIQGGDGDGKTIYKNFYDEAQRLARNSGEGARAVVNSLPVPAAA